MQVFWNSIRILKGDIIPNVYKSEQLITGSSQYSISICEDVMGYHVVEGARTRTFLLAGPVLGSAFLSPHTARLQFALRQLQKFAEICANCSGKYKTLVMENNVQK